MATYNHETLKKLEGIIGEDRLKKITSLDTDDVDDSNSSYSNSCEINCDCGTLILRPNHAKLILPSDPMLEVENELKFFQPRDRLFKYIIRGCYWLVDDMYKFEQMGYTKVINAQNLKTPASNAGESNSTSDTTNQPSGQDALSNNDKQSNTSKVLDGLRYLACAECNLCPLGWFDPKTKESYLHVWEHETEQKQPKTL